MKEKIGFFGAGKMAEGILSALGTSAGVVMGEKNAARAAELKAKYGVATTDDLKAVAAKCDLVFLAVRPQDVQAVADEVRGCLRPGQTLVSIVAGKTLAGLKRTFGAKVKLVRVMPNLALRAGAGMCAVASAPGAGAAAGRVVEILSRAGAAVLLAERHFDAVTALSGSGPAYFAYMEEAMAEGGVALGLPAKVARLLAEQTMFGTAKFLRESGMGLRPFIDGVCTKGGTTAAGMKKLAAPSFKRTVAATLKAAAARSAELALSLVAAVALAASAAAADAVAFARAVPAWVAGREAETNLFVAFETEFDCPEADAAELRIAAATVYRATLNGEFAGWGPARTDAGYAVIDTVPLRAKRGRNRLTVEVAGYNLNSYQYVRQSSFLCAEVLVGGGVVRATPADFTAHEFARDRKGPVYSRQRGFVSEGYTVGGAAFAPLALTAVATPKFLPRRAAYPAFAVVKPERKVGYCEFAHVESGFPVLEFECLAPGRIAIEFDEARGTNDVIDLWRNGDPMKSWHAMNNRIVWNVEKPGVYRVETMEPYTMQFLRTVTEKGAFARVAVSLRQCRNPLSERTRFVSSDPDLNRLFAASVESLAQNSVDVFTDCPSRERVGWLCDTYFTANAAAWLTGDFAIEREYLLNFVRTDDFGARVPKGAIPGFMPSQSGDVMPTYMMWYALQCEQAASRLGGAERREFVAAVRARIEGIFGYLARFERDGLLEDLPGWVFIEWSKANHYVKGVNFPANMLYSHALAKCGALFGRGDYTAKSARVAERVRQLARDPDRSFFYDQALRDKSGKLVVNRKAKTEICQYYAYFTGVASLTGDSAFWAKLVTDPEGTRKACGLDRADAFIGWMLRCHLLAECELGKYLYDSVRRYYVPMAKEGGTLWEFADGHDSRCHAFGSNAGALVLRSALGIREIDWARREVKLAPAPTALQSVEATFPLERGKMATFSIRVAKGVSERKFTLPEGWRAQ